MTGARIGTTPNGAEINSRLGFSFGKFLAHILDLKMDLEPFILVVTTFIARFFLSIYAFSNLSI